jgi:tetraacyldisaccharide 4'-kinase
MILTRADQVSETRRAEIWREIHHWCTPPGEVEVAFEADGLIDLNGHRTPLPNPEAGVETQRTVAFCGIGNPSAFRKTLEATGFEVTEMVSFPDHHNYSRSDLELLMRQARNEHCMLLTTLKDLVKIDHVADGVELLALNIRVRVMRGDELLMSALQTATENNVRTVK